MNYSLTATDASGELVTFHVGGGIYRPGPEWQPEEHHVKIIAIVDGQLLTSEGSGLTPPAHCRLAQQSRAEANRIQLMRSWLDLGSAELNTRYRAARDAAHALKLNGEVVAGVFEQHTDLANTLAAVLTAETGKIHRHTNPIVGRTMLGWGVYDLSKAYPERAA
jgi:hypothetical protein